jgi:hypothetical protein
MRAIAAVILAVSVVAAAACSHSPAAGSERGACKDDHACDRGLLCLSDLCVRPPAADCGPVAEALASVKLGNYATPAARAPVIAEVRAACTKQRLSADDARCLTAAKSKFEMSRCPNPLLPELVALAKDKGGCASVGARMKEMAAAEMAKNPGDPTAAVLPALIEAVVASCTEDGWSDEVKGCLMSLSASDTSAAQKCIDQMPKDVQAKFMKRIETIVEGAVKSGGPPAPPPTIPPPQ